MAEIKKITEKELAEALLDGANLFIEQNGKLMRISAEKVLSPANEALTKLDEKVDIYQGENNAGMYLAVGDDGNLTLVEGGGSGEVAYHEINYSLTGVTLSDMSADIQHNKKYTAAITVKSSFALQSVSITMGGADITSTAYNAETGEITINRVTGDVLITIMASADTSPVIEQTDVGYNSNCEVKSFAGVAITKAYDFTPDIDGIKASAYYDETNDYSTQACLAGIIKTYTPNVKMVEAGYSTSGMTVNASKVVIFRDGVAAWNFSNACLTGNNTEILLQFPRQNTNAMYANSIAFTISALDADDSYAYWTVNNITVLPIGVRSGDIIFAGKNTPYYGMANIDGTRLGEAATTALSLDDDIAQDYAVATASILGEDTATDTSTVYGISSDLAAVIDEVRTAWMKEYGGDYRKIPLIITTDQHGRINSGIWNMLAKTLSLHDVSKFCNLGDTVGVEWYDEDTTQPLISCAQLEKWCESIKAIPFSKRLDVYGNHDTWYGNYADEGNVVGTRYPENLSHLDQYFRNIYARRNNNNGWFVIRDDYFNVKYVVISGFEYVGTVTFRIGTKQMQFIIDEFGKDDGYDIVVISHVPIWWQDTTNVWPTGMETFTPDNETIMRVAAIDTDALFNARKNKMTGTVTDSDGVEHTFDFTKCTTDILCGLHGHVHIDGYNYVGGIENGLLNAGFDWFDGNTVHFVLVDRVNRVLNVWKLEGDALTYQNYQIPLDRPTE